MKLLHIDSSITGEQSVSRRITAEIVSGLKRSKPGLTVTYRDLAADPVPHHTGALLAAKTAGTSDPALQRDLQVTETTLQEFLDADIVVVGAPMYNFSVPSQLKAWIDSLAVAGRTFRYTETGAEGLCGGKRVIVVSSRGGIYSQPPLAALDHQESYLSGLFGFLGVKEIEFVRAEGVALGAEQRQQALDAALSQAHLLAAA